MGFMDKAKKLAEQAQEKLDEAQKNFNQGQGAAPSRRSGGVRLRRARPARSQEETPAAATPPPSATPPPDPTAPIADPAPPAAPVADASGGVRTRPPTRSSRSSQ